jgi:tRNA1(Val) A37 N6-methylase TrmN6
MLNENIRQADINNLSSIFDKEQFDGITTEPDLGPFYKERPYYIEIKKLIDSKLKQKFEATFREAYKVLKPKARISIVAPIFSTLDGGDITLNMDELARKHNFKPIPLLDLNRIANKSNQKLQFQRKHVKAMIDAKKGQIVKRKIYVFEKEI